MQTSLVVTPAIQSLTLAPADHWLKHVETAICFFFLNVLVFHLCSSEPWTALFHTNGLRAAVRTQSLRGLGVSRQHGATLKPRMKFPEDRIWEIAAGCVRRFGSVHGNVWRSASTILARIRGASAGCAVSSYVDRDRPVFCLRTFAMVGHLLDELSLVDQADVVKGIMEKARMVKLIDLFLAFHSRDEAAACGDPVAVPGPRSGTGRTLRRCVAVSCRAAENYRQRAASSVATDGDTECSIKTPQGHYKTEAIHACGQQFCGWWPRLLLLTARYAMSCALRLTLHGWDSGRSEQRSSVPRRSGVLCVYGMPFRSGPPQCSEICVLATQLLCVPLSMKRLPEAIRQAHGHTRGSMDSSGCTRAWAFPGCGRQATSASDHLP